MNQISKYLEERIENGDFPSAVYLVAEEGEVILEDAVGFAVVSPEKIKSQLDTIYDLASLTKPLVTGLLTAVLIENGRLNLSDKISKFFPEFLGMDKENITIEKLLTHPSGFPAWKPFYLVESGMSGAEHILAQIKLEPLVDPIGSAVVYSDLNFLILGFLLERIEQKPLDTLVESGIVEPLGLTNTFFNPPPELKKRIAASENGNRYERQVARNVYPEIAIPKTAFRDRLIWGEVHDNNCYSLNGVAGHAGLFSNIRETFKIARQFLPGTSTLLATETCTLFRNNSTSGLNQARSISFQLAETPDSTAGTTLPKDSFGHLGFTGTSLWIDPKHERIFILLTNRTHCRQLPLADMKETRQRFHYLATRILDE
jgi:CubicO group peptidase (beta-lactamase class C family)